jgi:transposase-like protein
MLNIENEFRQPLSIDEAPEGSVCEWCGKPAEHQFTALGGKLHNESGFLCRTCGDEFVRAVASSLCREVTPEEAVYG